MSEAIAIRGSYNIAGNKVTVTIGMFKSKVKVGTATVEGRKNDVGGLIQLLMIAIDREIEK